MPRPATGTIIVDKRRRSATHGLRFRAYGKKRYVRLGTTDEGWTRAKAQVELDNLMADVRRGIWQPPAAPPTRNREKSRPLTDSRRIRTAAARTIYMLDVLRDELSAYRARLDPTPAQLVFGSATGARQGATNIRKRVLTPAIERATSNWRRTRASRCPKG